MGSCSEATGSSAPFLAAASDGGRAITAGFPLHHLRQPGLARDGLTPGEHGMVGYTFAVPGFDRPMNSLQWELYGHGPNVDLLAALVPEEFQPEPTVMERAGDVGHVVTLIGPSHHVRSGLTRAILRGGRYLGADTLEDLVEGAAGALAAGLSSGPKVSVYAYHPFLDMFGHVNGAGSKEWREHLARVDGAARAIAERLPSGCVLAVTADHGMVNVDPAHRMDVADVPELRSGVRVMAGEARARHVHARPGAAADVLAIWSDVLEPTGGCVPGTRRSKRGGSGLASTTGCARESVTWWRRPGAPPACFSGRWIRSRRAWSGTMDPSRPPSNWCRGS